MSIVDDLNEFEKRKQIKINSLNKRRQLYNQQKLINL